MLDADAILDEHMLSSIEQVERGYGLKVVEALMGERHALIVATHPPLSIRWEVLTPRLDILVGVYGECYDAVLLAELLEHR